MSREGRIVGWMKTTVVFAARQKRWQELIRQQQQSQQPVSAFCRDHDISDASFYTWRKRLAASQPVRFALVEPSASGGNQPGSVELILASGDRLRITPGADAATLRTALSVLRERA